MKTICLHCKSKFPSRIRDRKFHAKYCSVLCQVTFQRLEKENKFLAGVFVGKLMGYPTNSWQRNLLIRLFGYKCNECGIHEWNNKSLTLEVNHIDGNAENNSVSNVEFLCPNCHSMTSTFRNLNKGSSKRIGRRKKVLLGE